MGLGLRSFVFVTSLVSTIGFWALNPEHLGAAVLVGFSVATWFLALLCVLGADEI